jgi:hypothetical protein
MRKIYILLFTVFFISSLEAQVKVNEVYGGGGNTGAPYRNDFVELYNNSGSSVNIGGWVISYFSAAGNPGGNITLSAGATIAANSYFLIQLGGGANGVLLPTPDATGTIAMSANNGRIDLLNNTSTLIDRVGYGTANLFEGAAAAPALTNTTSAQRTATGVDTDNNNADFTTGSPTPVNSAGPDIIPPTALSFIPTDDATNVATNTNLSITFSENIAANKGFVRINNTASGRFDLVDVLSPNVSISGATLTIYGVNLQPDSNYNVIIADTCFKDVAGNKYAGTNTATDWNFSTNPTGVPPITGLIGTSYNLNTISNIFGSDGFKQFSTKGGLTWSITTFGRNAASPPTGNTPYGLQLSGFDNALGSNVTNEDWLISPKFDLTATNFPLLSFWSRTKFNGAPLKLRVSTNYPGFGDPRTFTWTDLNGRFPVQTSDQWTESKEINLAAYKTSATYVAFVYTSTDDEGARWTLDDIQITNSTVPPPASLTISTTDIQFGYVLQGNNATKTFTFIGNDIVADATFTATGDFQLSKDNVTFSSSLNYTVAEANNISNTVYIRFSPTLVDRNFNNTVTVVSGTLNSSINVKGTSIDVVKTLELVNWNVEWFGSTVNGPTNDNQQENNVRNILINLNADLYGLVEVVDEARLASVVSAMPGYAYVIGNYGSHTNPFSPTPSPLSQAQKLAFVYRTSVFSNISTTPLLTVGINTAADISNPSYNSWASGRFPFMMTADVTLDGITRTVRFVLVHAKANTAPTTPSYNRRKAGADELYALFNSTYPTDNIVMLGDFNDDLDVTITDGITPNTTSYVSFTGDPINFSSPTLPLSLAGKKSTVSYNDVIDHVMVSNEMKNYYMSSTANILTDVAGLVTNYGSTTTDHYPVFSRFAFSAAILPVRLTNFTAYKQSGNVNLNWKTAEEINTKQFVIERSTDGAGFTAIGNVKAINSATGSEYEWTDNTPATINYYRLKMIDQDGKFAYSKVVKINFGKQVDVQITPNPASTYISIQINDASVTTATIQLIDLNGRIVKQQRLNQTVSNTIISLDGISKGLYHLKIITNQQVVTEKVVVQ